MSQWAERWILGWLSFVLFWLAVAYGILWVGDKVSNRKEHK